MVRPLRALVAPYKPPRQTKSMKSLERPLQLWSQMLLQPRHRISTTFDPVPALHFVPVLVAPSTGFLRALHLRVCCLCMLRSYPLVQTSSASLKMIDSGASTAKMQYSMSKGSQSSSSMYYDSLGFSHGLRKTRRYAACETVKRNPIWCVTSEGWSIARERGQATSALDWKERIGKVYSVVAATIS